MSRAVAATDSVEYLISDHAESRRRIASLKARLEAISVALDLAAVHVDCTIQDIDHHAEEKAFRAIPSAETIVSVCREYREEVALARALASALAEQGR